MSGESVVVEILGSHDRVRSRTRLPLSMAVRSFTIGRGVQADVIVDDEYLAPLHARFDVDEAGAVMVTDLGTVNGILIEGKRHRDVRDLMVTDGVMQVGRTRLRLRTIKESIAPEKPDHEASPGTRRQLTGMAAAGGVLCMGLVAYSSWLSAPRDTVSEVVTALIGVLAVTGVWVAAWALLGRMLQGEWRWTRHTVIFFWISSIYFILEGLLDLGWFAFSLPPWQLRGTLLALVAAAVILYLHLTTASGLSRRLAIILTCMIPAFGVGAAEWVKARTQARDVNHIGIGYQVFPPAFRLREAVDVGRFFDDAAQLKAGADHKRKSTRRESDDAEDDE
jgi:Inner membrane component of T3SS, cytoplasmic domain